MRRYPAAALVLALLLSGCAAEEQALPPPDELFAAVQAQAELPEMVDTAGTDLEALTGVGPDSYDSAVCYRLSEGTAPDEIVIVLARDGETADRIQSLLDQRLAYKQEAGMLYLTQFQPMLQAGVVRRDGLTVSLIVSERAEEIVQVYEDLRAAS